MYSINSVAAQYKRINHESGVESASPHRLVQMLMSGALERLIQARAAMEHGNVARKGESLGKATSIIAGLQASLSREQAPELVDNLDGLYDYMQRRLLEANVHNDVSKVDEVSELMRNIKSAWDEIGGTPV